MTIRRRPSALRWTLFLLPIVAGGLTASAWAAPAQAPTSQVRGFVQDATGRVPKAAVTLTNRDTGWVQRTESDTDGAFRFLAVPPARYRLVVTRAGFETATRDLELTIDQTIELSTTLTTQKLSAEAHAVAPDQPTVDSSKTSLGRTISFAEIDRLPIPTGQSRSFLALATLTPGVVPDVAANFAGVVTAGQTAGDNTFLIDGLSIDNAGNGATNNSLPIDAVQEFKVVSNHPSAEFGQASAAVVSVLTRSGGNTPAGRFSYFQQDSAWNASSAAAVKVGASDPGLQQEIADLSWGGSIARSRAFVFASAEQVFRHTSTINTSPVALTFRPDDRLSLPMDTEIPKVFLRSDVDPSWGRLTVRAGYQNTLTDNAAKESRSANERSRTLSDPAYDVATIATRILGTAAVNETRVHWARDRFEWDVDSSCASCAALNYPSLKLGKPPNAPQVTVQMRGEIADVLTWLAGDGRHQLAAGGSLSVSQLTGMVAVNTAGTYTFRSDTPFDPSNPASYPSMFTQSVGDSTAAVSDSVASLFVQDEWRPLQGLTLNVGLRWEHTVWPGPPTHLNDLAPRLGVSIAPWQNRRTVIRAAAGRYYDKSFLQIARDAATGFVQTVIANPGYQGDMSHFDPYGPNPNRPGPAVAQFSLNDYAPIQTPYTDQASVGVQRALGRHTALAVDIVRAVGFRLPVGEDLNYPDPATGRRPDPDPLLKQILVAETISQSWYTGLQVGIDRRAVGRFGYSVAYTLSSSQNDTDGARSLPSNQNNLLSDRGPTLNDARHRVTGTLSCELPRGWRVATVVTAASALPYNITTGADLNGDGMLNDRPSGHGRNDARGSAFFQADVRLSKGLRLGRQRFELLVEVFNLTNRANWTAYNGAQNQSSANQPTSSGTPRQIQLGVRFNF